jgi:LPS sulfotransferase NodH
VAGKVDTEELVRFMAPLRMASQLGESSPRRAISRLVPSLQANDRRRSIALVGPMPLRAAVASLLPDDIVQVEHPADLRPAPEQVTDVIVCTGRSGSSHLCDLLTSTGVCGRPAEHLREPMIHAIAHGHVDLDALMRRLVVAQATANGVFGTKVISRFLLELIDTVPVETLRRRLPPVKVIYLGRRDKIAQAASAIRAKKTGRWHVTGKPDSRPQVKPIELSGTEVGEAVAEYRQNLARQRQLDDLVDSLFPEPCVLRIWYEDLVEDPRDIVRRVCEHVGVKDGVDLARISSRHQKIPAEDRIYGQIRQSLDAADGMKGARQ